jgi:hypothetical protein
MTFANTISAIALFVALGGTGYATMELARNSVGTKQLKSSAVTSAKIRTHGVGSIDINTGAVGSRVLANRGVQIGDISSSAVSSLHAIGGQSVGVTGLPDGSTLDSQTTAVAFTLGRAGRVMVSATVGRIAGTCTGGGSCTASAAVTIDGTPVPGAIAVAQGGENRVETGVAGISADLAAGAHTVRTGSYISGSFNTGAFTGPDTYTITELG